MSCQAPQADLSSRRRVDIDVDTYGNAHIVATFVGVINVEADASEVLYQSSTWTGRSAGRVASLLVAATTR